MLWFWSSKVGRLLLAIGSALSFVLLFYFKGKKDQRDADKVKEAKVVENAKKIENEIDDLSTDDLRRRASRWVRK